MTRYRTDGTVDLVTSAVVGGSDAFARAVVAQPDGKLVVAGASAAASGHHVFTLARYTSTGVLDSTFDGDGMLTTAIGSAQNGAVALIQQTDGRLVAAGHAESLADQAFALARYNANGSLDLTFDGDGTVTTDVANSSDEVTALVQQPDGKLVAAGTAGTHDFALARYESSGALDATFDGDGRVVTSFGSGFDGASALVRRPDGSLVAGGWAAGSSADLFALARYRADGTLDADFDGDGRATVAVGTGGARMTALILQPDGKLVAGGWAFDRSGNRVFALARFEANVCGDGARGGNEACDLGAANGIAGACCNANCTFTAGSAVCRPAAGGCDMAETCSGAGSTCPPDINPACTPTASATATFTATPTDTAAPPPTATLSATATWTASRTPTATAEQTRTATPGETSTATPPSTATVTPTPQATATDTTTPSPSATERDAATATPSTTATGSPTWSASASPTASASATPSPSATPTVTSPSSTRCGSMPAPNCRSAAKSRLMLLRTNGLRDRLAWKWLRGAATSPGELGDPTAATAYAFCLFDANGLIATAEVAAGPQWTATHSGFRFSDPQHVQHGIEAMDLRSSDRDRARILISGRGVALPDPPLPLTPPVTLQLVNSGMAVCWQSVFDLGDVRRNRSDVFKANARTP